MVITALAAAQGITAASSGTVALERTPMPPPNTTNRAKDASGPEAAGAAEATDSGFNGSGDFIRVPPG
ncbi:hypothetical protein GCM10010094_24490 [Streptomyces flaveus]|uniref:Uncharacterized protein n=1 Tax=Streptomyces flaveus TaxID=66370 RepID=A0A917VCI8_9ACTN|nr:hypothetical protein GCM10010094_24490 [Streptomyces flaveus]